MDRLVQRPSAQLVDAPAQQPLGGDVHVTDVAGGVERAQRLAHAVGDRPQVIARLAQLLRGEDPLGRVHDHADEAARCAVVAVVHGARRVPEEPRSVLALQLALADPAARLPQRVERRLRIRMLGGRDDDLGHITTNDLAGSPAEDPLRAAAPKLDPAVEVTGDDSGVDLVRDGTQTRRALRLDERGAVVVAHDDAPGPDAMKARGVHAEPAPRARAGDNGVARREGVTLARQHLAHRERDRAALTVPTAGTLLAEGEIVGAQPQLRRA